VPGVDFVRTTCRRKRLLTKKSGHYTSFSIANRQCSVTHSSHREQARVPFRYQLGGVWEGSRTRFRLSLSWLEVQSLCRGRHTTIHDSIKTAIPVGIFFFFLWESYPTVVNFSLRDFLNSSNNKLQSGIRNPYKRNVN
jgi:hypothetical protein